MEQYILPAKEKVIIETEAVTFFLDKEVRPSAGEKSARVAIYLRNNRIQQVSVLKRGEQFRSPTDWRVISLPSEWLLIPGFVDCHVHLALDGINGFKSLTAPVPAEVLEKRLRIAANNGLVALRDGGDYRGTSLRVTGDSLPNYSVPQKAAYPQVIGCGKALYRRGCYGSGLGGEGVNNLHEAEELINSLKDEGASQLKVVLTGLVSFHRKGKVGALQFSAEEMRAIVQKAEKKGLPVMVHASSDNAVRMAVEAGVHSVEHGYFLQEKTLELMAERKVSWVPTVAPVGAALKLYKKEQKSPERELLQDIMQEQLAAIKKAQQLGVSLGIGTDTGSPGVTWEAGYHQELLFFHQAGLSPLEILRIAVQNGTRILGLGSNNGTITRGKKLKCICLHKKFFTSPRDYTEPEAIFKTT